MRQQHHFTKHFRVSFALHVVVLFFLHHFSFAQTYPVSATLQLTPPYSVFLSDYTVNDQMKLHLLLRDLNEPSYQVRLSLVLEGVGIRIETNPNLVPPPIFIEGGIPTILSAEDLAPYLDSRNLIFSGISRQEYEQRAALPEGFYRFCFRVHDYKRKEVILSQEACAQAWFMLNDPPRINTPLCGTTLPVRDPQNILFQWLPMNANSPNSAFTTEYEFTLVEIRPPGRNPNDAMNVGYPLFQTNTQQTSLMYGLLEPPLIPGQEYAFRVRAIDTEGRDQFKNRGYSEVCTFKFGDTNGVPPPEGMNVTVEGERRAKVNWFINTETDKYRIEYRKKSTGTDYAWFTIETEQDSTLIQDLEPNTEYEVRVAGILRNKIGSYSPSKTFRTLPPKEYACGQAAESIVTTNTKPLMNGMVGQIWKLDLFDMIVMEVSGGNGTYSGLGAVLIPFWGVKFFCHFENIKINEKQELIAGEVYTVEGDVEALKKRLTDQNEKKKKDKAKSNGSSFEGVDVKFNGTIDSLYVNEEGEVIAIVAASEGTSGGSSKKEERKIETKKGADNRITDDSGNVYVVGKDGKVEKMGSTGATGTTAVASNVNYRVDFESSSNQAYGFDQQQYSEHERNYEKYERDGKIYTIPWKSVASDSRDIVIAKSTESRKDFSKEVIYKTNNGLLLRKPGNQENEVLLTVEGFGDQSTEQVTAYYKRKDADGKEKEVMAGKLNLVSYDKLVERLVIVSVNNTAPNISTSDLAESLNTIFAPAAVEWTVESQSITDLNYDTNGKSGLDDGSSGLFSNYTGEMRTVINAYKDKYDIASRTWYLFLVPNSESGRTQGFMPRKKQAGFIFTEQLGEASLVKVIAHEIGHGAFRLEHSFDTYNTLEKYYTDNLMDYQPNGITLHKYQWDLIHDPAAVLGLFEGDEGGAMVAGAKNKLSVLLCDSLVQAGKVYYQNSDTCKLHIKLERKDTTISQVTVKLVASISGTKNKMEKSFLIKSFGEKQHLAVDSLPDGKYEMTATFGKATLKQSFFYRKKQCDYACKVCGLDLTVTHGRLKKIFNNKGVTSQDANWFNNALKKAGVNTCKKQIHIFSQMKVETKNFKAFIEDLSYQPSVFLSTFSNNCNLKSFYNQNFWTNKTYKKYFTYKVYEFDTIGTGTKYKGNSEVKYTWNPNTDPTTQEAYCKGVVKSAADTIRIPTNFELPAKKEKGQFKAVRYSDAQKTEIQKRLMSLTYASRMGNRDSSSNDGYNFRGRGAIHLTGREAYQKVSEKANDLFNTKFNWEINYDNLQTNNDEIIYSGVAFFAWKLNDNLDYLQNNNVTSVSIKVNGGKNGLPDRIKAFNLLLDTDLFDCTISKE